MDTKALVGVEVKDASQGIVRVKFAAYDEIDKHGDVTKKGAYDHGAQVVVSAYNHDSWKGTLPVGKGVLDTDGDAPYADLQFFMNTTAGRETFEVVKAMGDMQEWSYGLVPIEVEHGKFKAAGMEEEVRARYLKKIKVHEISPVLVGAGNSTATVAVKAADGFSPEEKEKYARMLEEGMSPKQARAKILAMREKDDKKGFDIPGAEGTLKMSDQCVAVVAAVKSLADRAEEIVTLRKADGKDGLAPSTAVLLDLLVQQADRVKALLSEQTETKDAASADSSPELDAALIAQSLHNLSE